MTDMIKLELYLQLRVNTNAEMQKSQYPGNYGNKMFKLEARHLVMKKSSKVINWQSYLNKEITVTEARKICKYLYKV